MKNRFTYMNMAISVKWIKFFRLNLRRKAGKLKDGDVVVLVSAGIGYAWGAITVKWGKQEGG